MRVRIQPVTSENFFCKKKLKGGGGGGGGGAYAPLGAKGRSALAQKPIGALRRKSLLKP